MHLVSEMYNASDDQHMFQDLNSLLCSNLQRLQVDVAVHILDFTVAAAKMRQYPPAKTRALPASKIPALLSLHPTITAVTIVQVTKRVTYANGDVYDGQWKLDRKEGQGVYRIANGNIYFGHCGNRQ